MSAVRIMFRLLAWMRGRRERVRLLWRERQARRLLQRKPRLAEDLAPEALMLVERFRGLSVNRANQLRMQHDRIMRPQELQGFLLAWLLSGDRSPALSAWLCETCTDAPSLLEAPARYATEVAVGDLGVAQLRWYRRAASDCEPMRRLVVAFASNANAVAMITPCFLQLLAPLAADVVLVLRHRPHQQTFYGHDGDSSLLARLLKALPSLVPLSDYREVVTIGYSGGGFAAAVAALALGADRGVSLGGAPPMGRGIDRAWMEALRSVLPPPRAAATHLLFCCAEGCAADVTATARAAATVVGWELPIGSWQTRAYGGCRHHNMLVELQRRRYALLPVVADLLFPDDRSRYPKPLLARQARWRPLTAAPGSGAFS